MTEERKPSLLADSVGQLIMSVQPDNKNESDEDDDYNELYRDLEQERQAQVEGNEKEREEGRDELAVGHEEDIISDLIAEEGLEEGRDRGDLDEDIARMKHQKKERDRDEQEAAKAHKKKKDELEASVGLLSMAKAVFKKLMAFKMHSVASPDKQAGIFDKESSKGLDGKRRVVHDFKFGAESRIDNFTAELGDQQVEGTIMRKVDSNKKGDTVQIGDAQVSINSAGVQDVSSSDLGKLSPDSIANSIGRDGGVGR